MKPSWSERAKAGNGLPNLGLGGSIVAALITSFFAAKIACALLIVVTQGWHAYFVEGMRVKDWKQGIMSNGEPLPFPGVVGLGLSTFVLWMLLIAIVEWIAGFVPGFLGRCGSRSFPVARLIGGLLLILLSLWFYRFAKSPLIHPIPVSSLIGGSVLLLKGVNNILRKG